MRVALLRTQSAKNTIFAFPKTFTIFYLSIYYFKAKVRLILTLIMVILGNAEIADWVLSNIIPSTYALVGSVQISRSRSDDRLSEYILVLGGSDSLPPSGIRSLFY